MNTDPMPQGKIDLKLISICVLICFGCGLLTGWANTLTGQEVELETPRDLVATIGLNVLVAPVIATLFFHALPFTFISLFRERLGDWFKHCFIIVSAILFVLSYGLSGGFTLGMYIPGITLAYSYFRSKEENRPAFTTTMLILMLYSVLAILWNHFLEGEPFK